MATTHIEHTDRGRVVIDQATVSKLGKEVTEKTRQEVRILMAFNIAKFLLDQGLIEFAETETDKMHVFKAYLELASVSDARELV